jgi:DnaJ-class molecular chaperone
MGIGQNFYELLGISPTASAQEIREAYRQQAFRYHPDRNQLNLTTNEKMEKINEAYATLSDPIKRKEYDVPMGYRILVPKFKAGSKVTVSSHSSAPFKDHIGLIENEPVKDMFRFWYTVKFNLNNLDSVSRFAEEELDEVKE